MRDGELDPVAKPLLEEECTGLATIALRPRLCKAGSIHCVGFHPRGDVNWNICERRASKKPLRGVEQILHAQ